MSQDKFNFSGVRDTSLKAYWDLVDHGGQKTQEGQIFFYLAKTGPKTLQEINEALCMGINAVSGRVNGLKRKGLVVECERRKCKVTGRLVIPVTVLELDS